MSHIRRSLLLAALCLLAITAAKSDKKEREYHEGDGTAYSGDGQKDKTGFNSCQFGELDSHWEQFYAALPSQVFDRKVDCGRCILARGTEDDAPGDWVKVMIVDECASCEGDGDVDFSKDALKAITGYSWDRKRIEWQWAEDCSTDDINSDGVLEGEPRFEGESDDDDKKDKKDKKERDDDDGNDKKSRKNRDKDNKDEEDDSRRKNRRLLRRA